MHHDRTRHPQSALSRSTHVDLLAPCRATRIRIMLTLGTSFTPGQVASLMAEASRWGRQSASDRLWHAGYDRGTQEATELFLDDLSRAHDVPAFSERALRMDEYRQTARREADTAAGHPWLGDHAGGRAALRALQRRERDWVLYGNEVPR